MNHLVNEGCSTSIEVSCIRFWCGSKLWDLSIGTNLHRIHIFNEVTFRLIICLVRAFLIHHNLYKAPQLISLDSFGITREYTLYSSRLQLSILHICIYCTSKVSHILKARCCSIPLFNWCFWSWLEQDTYLWGMRLSSQPLPIRFWKLWIWQHAPYPFKKISVHAFG